MSSKWCPPKPRPLVKPRPKIADVQCARMQFQNGDKVLVRVYQRLSEESRKKLHRSVQKWADPAEVLIVDCTIMDIEVDKSGGIV